MVPTGKTSTLAAGGGLLDVATIAESAEETEEAWCAVIIVI